MHNFLSNAGSAAFLLFRCDVLCLLDVGLGVPLLHAVQLWPTFITKVSGKSSDIRSNRNPD